MIRVLVLLTGFAVLAGCAGRSLDDPLVPLGDFKLGHNVVVASKAQQGPISRKATEQDWTSAMTQAMSDRFGRYQGDELYHFGVSVEGFMLAPPGVPLVYTPKSALIINVTVWDDAAGRKLNDEPEQFTILETTGTDSIIIGSGIGRSRQQQLDGLSFNAARTIETWLADQHENYGWFTDNPVFNPQPEEAPPAER